MFSRQVDYHMRTQDNQLYSILVCRFLLAYLYWDYQLYTYMLSVHEIYLKKISMQIRKFSVFPIVARCRYTSFMRILLENAKIFFFTIPNRPKKCQSVS